MLGKIIGGLIGYWLGGFWGFLLGIYLGHQLDKRMTRIAGGYLLRTVANYQAKTQQVFFEATFSVMGCLAKADGRVSEEEIALARQVMQRMGLSAEVQRQAMQLFAQGKEPDFDLDAVLQKLHQATRGRMNLIQMFIEIQLGVGYADGTLKTAERDLLLRICDRLGFPVEAFERLEAMIQAEIHHHKGGSQGPTLEDAYAILSIEESATDAEVKRAYRRLTSQHHPDKLAAKGLPPEMMKLAQEKTHEIRTAYEKIRETRGFK
ncbi:MAG TPA: co-chaperone DjlA [Candidatus Tenderia electrophaga]|uniref:Co-chaperone protein DjlA n=1 Tax=Candidatus Tenderia electrophaga TaxID=1748243 RepID=A0A832J9F2_9GAMM|nr:co-chaperone DjlA [Candidatus Tenderia electrophaga]